MSKTYRQSVPLQDQVDSAVDAANGGGTIVVETGTTPLIRKVHMGKIVSCTNASAVALTLPQDSADTSINIGESFRARMDGAGQVTVTAGAGATLRKAAATAKILAQYGEVRITKVAANTWSANGELAAS